MHFFKNIYGILLSITCMLVSTSMVGMKRSLPQTNPCAAQNIQELHRDILTRIVRELWPKQRNILRRVSSFFQSFAGKRNIDALFGPKLELLDRTYLLDILDMLRKCVATNNIALYAQILTHPNGKKVHPCYHRQMLIDAPGIVEPSMYKVIQDACPDYNFKDMESGYNQMLFFKKGQRGEKLCSDRVLSQGKKCDDSEINLPKDSLKLALKSLIINQPTAVAQYIEEYWTKNKTNPSLLRIQQDCLALLRRAAIAKNTAVVHALLETTPFKNHFQADGVVLHFMGIRHHDQALHQLYWNTLWDVIDYSNRDIWHAIFTWASSAMNTAFITTNFVDALLERGQYWHLRTLCKQPEMLIEALITAVRDRKWLRLDGLSTVFDDVDITCSPIRNHECLWVYFCKAVLYEANPLPVTVSYEGDLTYKQIKKLKTAEPTIFEKLCKVCHRLLSGMIKSTIRLAIDDESMVNNLENCLMKNPSLRSLMLSVAQDLRQEYQKKLTTIIDPLLIEKIKRIDDLIQHHLYTGLALDMRKVLI